jgi:hypothetical protein
VGSSADVSGVRFRVPWITSALAERSREDAMCLIREVLRCKPGKVRPMVENFRVISKALIDIGEKPLRLLTDASGEPFWTVVAETEVERIDEYFAIEQKLMANDRLRHTLGDYHDLVESGRREIFRVES